MNAGEGHLPGTAPFQEGGDFGARMVAGLSAFLDRQLAAVDAQVGAALATPRSTSEREAAAHAAREGLARRIGVVDARLPIHALELVGTTAEPALRAATGEYEVYAVRWPVLRGMDGEGLLLRPQAGPLARVVALPDADQTPECLAGLTPGLPPESQLARCLAEAGCEVVVPVLLDRSDAWSANPALGKATNLPHREFLWRMAFEVGRHPIGFEVQKVLALVDLFASQGGAPVGVYGYGEGGLLALHAGALDPRLGAVAVSGHFRNRRQVWREPVYRDVWGLLRGFGDAELAALVAPRPLVVEAVPGPTVTGPPPAAPGRAQAAPGVLDAAPPDEVRAEVDRARPVYEALGAAGNLVLVEQGGERAEGTAGSGPGAALRFFLAGLGIAPAALDRTGQPPPGTSPGFDPAPRLRRQLDQLCAFTQDLIRHSGRERDAYWSGADASSPEAWRRTSAPYRDSLWEEVIGQAPAPSLPPNARTRRLSEQEAWTSYEVVLDVWPDVFAYGLLLLPRDARAAGRRPVVVCQHGLEGRPQHLLEPDAPPYNAFAARLAERGYVVYAPQNPYLGGESFRVLQRKAHPLGWSLFSLITAQHQRTLEWLAGQPFVDPARIAFYGLSYGGKTAVRVPALLDGYCLSICSADFNEWVVKCASTEVAMSYLWTAEYDMYEFDLAHRCNYAELAALIAPRPFMVERGHRDGVSTDEWVAFEYARVRRRYADLGLPQRTEIEFFEGGHQIQGQGTFAFLDRHLGWSP